MLEIIAIVILISSILGIGIIIYRKIPALKTLPEPVEKPIDNKSNIKKKVKNLLISNEKYLQKILSKIRILFLKIDNKTFGWLQELRKRSQKREDEKKIKRVPE